MSVALAMIVRDEARVIVRCLEAVRPHVSSAWIVDTGSSDGTQDLVREWLARQDLPGEVLDRPWRGFAGSRTEALELARARVADRDPGATHVLMIDADDLWTPAPGFAWPEPMEADAYDVKIRMGDLSWPRPQVTRAEQPWRYVGESRHEYVDCDEPFSKARLFGVEVVSTNDGQRRQLGAAKYDEDIAAMKADLERDPGNRRTVFYLAQSYRDANRPHEAIACYRRRLEMGWPVEELWLSHYRIAQLLEQTGAPLDQVLAAYDAAYEFRPQRAEPIACAARLCRIAGRHARAFLYAAAARDLPLPEHEILFVEEDCYRWRALDEYALACFNTGRAEAAKHVWVSLFMQRRIPQWAEEQTLKNLSFCQGGAEIVERLAAARDELSRRQDAGAAMMIALRADDGRAGRVLPEAEAEARSSRRGESDPAPLARERLAVAEVVVAPARALDRDRTAVMSSGDGDEHA